MKTRRLTFTLTITVDCADPENVDADQSATDLLGVLSALAPDGAVVSESVTWVEVPTAAGLEESLRAVYAGEDDADDAVSDADRYAIDDADELLGHDDSPTSGG